MWQHKLMESSLSSVSAMSPVIGSFIRNFLKWEMLPDMYLGIFNFDAASITRVTGVCMYAVSETGFVEAFSALAKLNRLLICHADAVYYMWYMLNPVCLLSNELWAVP